MAYNLRYKPKNNKCKMEGCNNIKGMGFGGWCRGHKELDPMFESKQKKKALKAEMPKIKKLISSIDDKLVNNSAAKEFQLLQNFFSDAAIELSKKPKCEECGSYISPVYYRSSIAHLLPKRKEYGFPSVASHPLNKLFLGAACGCHSTFDSTWEQASKMKVWPKAIIIFKELYPFIHPSEHKNIPDILRIHIPKD